MFCKNMIADYKYVIFFSKDWEEGNSKNSNVFCEEKNG